MRILFLVHAFNGLSQRLYVELRAAGHEVSVEFDINDAVTQEAVALYRPDLVIAPFMKRAIPESIWREHCCIVLHPGIGGDRGPSALDWAIVHGETHWGVTALQATGEMDAGPIWATVGFPMREASKSSLYRNEVTEAAVVAIRKVLAHLAQAGPHAPAPDSVERGPRGQWRPLMRQADRAIDWHADDTRRILLKVRAADGTPGVRDALADVPCFLYDAHAEAELNRAGEARPGKVIAQRAGAVCVATRDAAVWITHLKRAGGGPHALKLPAAVVLGEALAGVPDVPLAAERCVRHATWRDIAYEERGRVGYLHFAFYNGAMGTAHCERLRAAYAHAKSRPTRVIVLTGGPDFWSNGIHLNLIEADPHPAEASWRNINAMNDLVRDIIETESHLTVAALRGNAGAGGAFLALAADRVYARSGVVLNPHYKSMGNLYGSEYWTYLLPRRTDASHVCAIIENRLPIGAPDAVDLGLLDAHFGADVQTFMAEVRARAEALADGCEYTATVAAKRARRAADEAAKPLACYRDEELAQMKLNFFGFDPSYHVARYNFVAKVPRSRTPVHLALHRRRTHHAPRPFAPRECDGSASCACRKAPAVVQ